MDCSYSEYPAAVSSPPPRSSNSSCKNTAPDCQQKTDIIYLHLHTTTQSTLMQLLGSWPMGTAASL